MKKRKKRILFALAVTGMLLAFTTGCGKSEENQEPVEVQEATVEESVTVEETAEEITEEAAEQTETTTDKRRMKTDTSDIKACGYDTFEVTSEDISEGVWNTIITNTENGANVSPQLSWEAVEGAASYVVCMADSNAGNWVHWASYNVTDTNLPQGWAPENEYVGPYPPGGTHTYEVYVIALKQPVEKIVGRVDASNYRFMRDLIELNVLPDGTEGNIVAYGYLPGTYTYGE